MIFRLPIEAAGIPRQRLIAPEDELRAGQCALVRDKGIDAGGEAFQRVLRLAGQARRFGLGRAPDADREHELIDRKQRLADHLGKSPERGAMENIELPEAVLGHRVAEAEHQIIEAIGADMRDALRIAPDFDWVGEAGERD